MRCGLFHAGFTDGPTLLCDDEPSAITISGRFLMVNPRLFVQCALNDFNLYIRELRSNSKGELAKKFLTLWDKRWDES